MKKLIGSWCDYGLFAIDLDSDSLLTEQLQNDEREFTTRTRQILSQIESSYQLNGAVKGIDHFTERPWSDLQSCSAHD